MKKNIYKLLFLFSVICILLGNIETKKLFAAPNDVVNIPDSNLKAVLNSALGNVVGADITETQMASITSLTLNNASIADLTGLEYATGVTYLYVYENQVSNLEPIKSMNGLISISLSGNNITSSNFPDLSQLPSLTRLDLGGAAVDNAVLEKVNKILTLSMVRFQSNYNITTIEPLTNLPNLTELWVQFCGINDFRPINNMPLLTNMAGAGQNTGRTDPHTILNRSSLDYDEVAQTLYIPFSMMPNVLTNFDGTKAPFTTSTSSSMTYVGFNNVAVVSTRLAIDSNGITVSDVTLSEFQGLNELEYNAFYNLPAGSYTTPPGFNFYAISGGTYDHYFDITDPPIISANTPIYYWENQSISESQFLADISASTNDGSLITSDFTTKVDFSKPGSYVVTLNATNASGIQAEPVQIQVIVKPLPTLSAKEEITYYQFSNIEEQLFYQDIEVTTESNNQIISDFLSVVNFNVIGTYNVTITAKNDEGISSNPTTVTVHIIPINNMYKLSFNLNGGSGKNPSVQNLKFDSLASKPENPYREGFVFSGWNTEQKGNGLNWDFNKTTMPKKDVILYAQWKEAIASPNNLKVPVTGDSNNLLWLCMILISTGGIILLVSNKKKQKVG